jgi:hypothetical protein
MTRKASSSPAMAKTEPTQPIDTAEAEDVSTRRAATLEAYYLRSRAKRRWLTVDAAVRWATADSTSPQAAKGIDPSRAMWASTVATRVVTVRARGTKAAASPWQAEAAYDRAMVMASVSKLERIEQAVLVWYAWGHGYREIAALLREHSHGMSNTRLMVLHRYGRERIARKLRELGYLEDV